MASNVTKESSYQGNVFMYSQKKNGNNKLIKCIFCTLIFFLVQFLHFYIDLVQFLHYTIHRGAITMNLKDIRKEKKMTQQQVADLIGISLRSYKSYENDVSKEATIKYNYIIEKLKAIDPIDEDHGIVDLEYIKEKCNIVFDKYDIDFCYLFGSYAKNKANEQSDIDLLISSDIRGLQYYGLVEELRTTLHKRVDALNIEQLNNNMPLLQEILKDGVKIYG